MESSYVEIKTDCFSEEKLSKALNSEANRALVNDMKLYEIEEFRIEYEKPSHVSSIEIPK